MAGRGGARRRATTNKRSTSSDITSANTKTRTKLGPIGWVLLIIILVGPVSLANVASQIQLHPLYGSTVTSKHFQTVSLLVCLLSTIPTKKRLNARLAWSLMSILIAGSPFLLHRIGSWTATRNSATWGPIASQLFVSTFIQYLAISIVIPFVYNMSPKTFEPFYMRMLAGVPCWFAIARGDQIWWDRLPGSGINSCSIYIFLPLACSIPAALLALANLPSYTSSINPSSFSSPSPSSSSSTAQPTTATSTVVDSQPPAPTSNSSPSAPTKPKSKSTPRNPNALAAIHLSLPLLISILSQRSSPCNTRINYPYTPSSANGTLRILDKGYSVTGMLLVGENLLPHAEVEGGGSAGYRFLRCDHSLLGGRWFKPGTGTGTGTGKDAKEIDMDDRVLDESIYSAFIVQEAVRLVEKETRRAKGRVLSIGLGVGISINSFIAHNLDVTLLEIDPLVYKFASQYFDLSEPSSAYFEDARQWVHQRGNHEGTLQTSWTPELKYDYVVHDVFSGGGVPEHLFTMEFWKDLKGVMDPDGVVAVNFVGRFGSPAAKAILTTLLSSFASCRIFHDHYPPEEVRQKDEFLLNMVFFCTPSSTQLIFRRPNTTDFLGTRSRQVMLGHLPEFEINPARILGDDLPIALKSDSNASSANNSDSNSNGKSHNKWILTDERNQLGEWQEKGAIEHWELMQTVLSHETWSSY